MSEDGFVEKYRDELFPIYQSLAFRTAGVLSDLLDNHGIDIAQIDHRAKTPESVSGKLVRKNYADPISEIRDFAGLRVITFYNDDVDKVANVIRSEFEADASHSTDKLSDLNVDEFGYRSFHLVCRLGDQRCNLAEWKKYSDLWFEVQVRSILQHAWAGISHKLDYKNASEVPGPLRRRLFRLSALLELADDEFQQLRNESTKLVESYKEASVLSLPLNLDSLEQYISTSVDLNKWRSIGMNSGMLKDRYEFNREDTSRLLETLSAMKLSTIEQVDNLIMKNEPHAEELLRAFVRKVDELGQVVFAAPVDVLNFTLCIAERENLSSTFRFDDTWVPAVSEAMNSTLHPEETYE